MVDGVFDIPLLLAVRNAQKENRPRKKVPTWAYLPPPRLVANPPPSYPASRTRRKSKRNEKVSPRGLGGGGGGSRRVFCRMARIAPCGFGEADITTSHRPTTITCKCMVESHFIHPKHHRTTYHHHISAKKSVAARGLRTAWIGWTRRLQVKTAPSPEFKRLSSPSSPTRTRSSSSVRRSVCEVGDAMASSLGWYSSSSRQGCLVSNFRSHFHTHFVFSLPNTRSVHCPAVDEGRAHGNG
jgi:hypothetical protein